ncbi:hypothetical protein KTT_39260 [Tengunoibacter tsumagoiensis]|uniref:non-specific serine/threonine protein kinase n=1 Tax=Tengunoibacter tsumagoiensis TaxID=2014871 RepID=A0A402A4I9_9CHLR|nr:hypothetical protein KTT_39260 [Tengunoibacter tsumagoiensis]
MAQNPPISSAALPPSSGDAVSPRRLPSGTLLSADRYQIDRLIASGGMGAVYRAIDTRFKRPCAVKEMLDDFRNESERAQSVEWFSREATLLLELNHPCIPRVRDFFAENGRHYLVMDFIDGRTLAETMDTEANIAGVNGARGLPEEKVRDWTHQICGVLSYLHQLTPPIIFRDLKPSNIMVTSRGEIKLIDFGIARTFQSQNQSTVIMTLGYAPPEQLHGMPEPRSDLFALGSTMHKLLTRHDPANNKPSIFNFPPVRVLRPDVSPALEQVISKALALPLDQRWSSAEEMDRAILKLPPISQSQGTVETIPGRPGDGIRSTNGSGGNIHAVSQVGIPSGPIHMGTTGPAGPQIMTAQEHLNAARIEAAYEAVKMAHGLEQNNPLVHKLFGQVYIRRNPPQVDIAMNAYNRSLQLNANDAETHKLVGDVYLYYRPNLQMAIQAYIQSLRLQANDWETHERLGIAYERANQFAQALREYQEAIRLGTNVPENVRSRLFFALGQLAMRLSQWNVAEFAFVQVLTLNPSDNLSRFLLSQVYENEGKLPEALRECNYVLAGQWGATNPAVKQMYDRLRNRLGR